MCKIGVRYLEKRGKFSFFSNRGQLTMFIIFGLVFVLSIIVFFLIFAVDQETYQPPSLAPRVFIEKCLETAVLPSLQDVFDYGGVVSRRHYTMRYGVDYNYLCYAENYYEKCINYYPMLNHIAEAEIREDSISRVKVCFEDLISDYESRGYDVSSEELNYFVEVVPGNIRLRITKPIVVTNTESTERFKNFDTNMPSDLYDLIGISRTIVNQEAEYCYFEGNGFMIMYPRYNVTRVDYLESKLYEVQNRYTKEVFRFGVRSCPYAPGVILK